MSNINFQVPLDPAVVVSSADADELPLKHFKVVVLVDSDLASDKPKLFEEEDGQLIWEQVTEELMGFVSDFVIETEGDAEPLESSEIDTLLVCISLFDSGMVYEIAQHAYLVFPQGMNGPDYKVLSHLSYWFKGVAADHAGWKVAVIGSILEDEVARTANAICATGMSTTILTRYCL